MDLYQKLIILRCRFFSLLYPDNFRFAILRTNRSFHGNGFVRSVRIHQMCKLLKSQLQLEIYPLEVIGITSKGYSDEKISVILANGAHQSNLRPLFLINLNNNYT